MRLSIAKALLPRLPDTAEELRSIALALQADPAKVLHLGKDANEKAVRAAAQPSVASAVKRSSAAKRGAATRGRR